MEENGGGVQVNQMAADDNDGPEGSASSSTLSGVTAPASSDNNADGSSSPPGAGGGTGGVEEGGQAAAGKEGAPPPQTQLTKIKYGPGPHPQQLLKRDKRQSSSRFNVANKNRELQKLPPLRDAGANDREELFINKIRQCGVLFDFVSDPLSDLKWKEVKRAALNEMVEYVTTQRQIIININYLIQIIVNYVRTINFGVSGTSEFDPEEDEPTLEAAWPHLQLVYEFFLRFLESPDFQPSAAKRFIDQKFVLQLLELFDSEDPRERDFLKTTLHRIYGKFLGLRAFIRKQINNIFYKFFDDHYVSNHKGCLKPFQTTRSPKKGNIRGPKEDQESNLVSKSAKMAKIKLLNAFHKLIYCMVYHILKGIRHQQLLIFQWLKRWARKVFLNSISFISDMYKIFHFIGPTSNRVLQQLLQLYIRTIGNSRHFMLAQARTQVWTFEYILLVICEN
ncbi:unnamed protein product, partial [Meganyctiphanes norvegica]